MAEATEMRPLCRDTARACRPQPCLAAPKRPRFRVDSETISDDPASFVESTATLRWARRGFVHCRGAVSTLRVMFGRRELGQIGTRTPAARAASRPEVHFPPR